LGQPTIKAQGHSNDEKILYFSKELPRKSIEIRVSFWIKNSLDLSDPIIEMNTKIACEFLDTEIAAGRPIGRGYQIRNGQMFLMP
jgi:hypothetical protein